jgi:thioredoxin reductase
VINEEVIIIGAGPAGLATALQLERYGIKPLIIEHKNIGGLLNNANLVENYPGFPGGISGPQLVDLFKQQVNAFQLNLVNAHLENLDYVNDQFEFSADGQLLRSRLAVVASGTKPHKLKEVDIPAQIQTKVYYEVYPLLDEIGKQIAIIGAGDAAFDYAINLAQENDVFVFNRGDKISSLPLLWERAQLIPHIHYHQETAITRISVGPDARISLDCKTLSGSSRYIVDYLIGAIGREPNLDFISGQFSEKAIQLENSGKLYYVGDVVNGLFRQTAIAVGDGILAAMKIYKYLKENE